MVTLRHRQIERPVRQNPPTATRDRHDVHRANLLQRNLRLLLTHRHVRRTDRHTTRSQQRLLLRTVLLQRRERNGSSISNNARILDVHLALGGNRTIATDHTLTRLRQVEVLGARQVRHLLPVAAVTHHGGGLIGRHVPHDLATQERMNSTRVLRVGLNTVLLGRVPRKARVCQFDTNGRGSHVRRLVAITRRSKHDRERVVVREPSLVLLTLTKITVNVDRLTSVRDRSLRLIATHTTVPTHRSQVVRPRRIRVVAVRPRHRQHVNGVHRRVLLLRHATRSGLRLRERQQPLSLRVVAHRHSVRLQPAVCRHANARQDRSVTEQVVTLERVDVVRLDVVAENLVEHVTRRLTHLGVRHLRVPLLQFLEPGNGERPHHTLVDRTTRLPVLRNVSLDLAQRVTDRLVALRGEHPVVVLRRHAARERLRGVTVEHREVDVEQIVASTV